MRVTLPPKVGTDEGEGPWGERPGVGSIVSVGSAPGIGGVTTFDREDAAAGEGEDVGAAPQAVTQMATSSSLRRANPPMDPWDHPGVVDEPVPGRGAPEA
jgi:hypothetical protein